MISAYNPILRKVTSESPDWYRHFNSVFYMSQLTNQILLSYMETTIESDKSLMLSELDNELKAKKIIYEDSKSGSIIIPKEAELKSIHIEDVIEQIIENVFSNRGDFLQHCAHGMGLHITGNVQKEVEIDRQLLLDATTSRNWYELLKGLLNVWEFIFLYGAVESALKDVLGKSGQVREENLVNEIYQKYEALSDVVGFEQDDIEKVWIFYTELRNIYVHNHGHINGRIKSNIGGKLEDMKKAIYSMHKEEIMIIDLEAIMKKHLVKNSKFYFMRDTELNVFRNTVIHFIESVENVFIDAKTAC
ncbi:hypothetical protein [Photobacterium sp. DNB22_13_2]